MEDISPLRIETEQSQDHLAIRVAGELTLVNTGKLRTALLESLQLGKKTILDGANIIAIDLSGLQLICSAHRSYAARGVKFEFAAAAEPVQETARAAGFDVCGVCRFRKAQQCVWSR